MGWNPFKEVKKLVEEKVFKPISDISKGNFKAAGQNILGSMTQLGTGGTLKFDGKKVGLGWTGQGTLDGVTKGIGELSGANALKKQLDQESANQQAALARQQATSDAITAEAGNRDDARIGFGKRKKSNKVSNSAGLGGVSQGAGTGVQS